MLGQLHGITIAMLSQTTFIKDGLQYMFSNSARPSYIILGYAAHVLISKQTRKGQVLLYCNDCVVDSDVSYNVELDNAKGKEDLVWWNGVVSNIQGDTRLVVHHDTKQ